MNLVLFLISGVLGAVCLFCLIYFFPSKKKKAIPVSEIKDSFHSEKGVPILISPIELRREQIVKRNRK